MKNKILFLLIAALMQTNCQTEVTLSEDSTWYEFHPENSYDQQSLIGLEDWNNEHAGKYGRIISEADKLIYNGEEIKLWGINNTYGACSPEKELADKRAAFYRKFGVNSVRLHKYADGFGSQGIQTENSFVDFDKDALNRMDYYINILKENGIYTKISPTFGVKIGPGDISRVPFYKELGEFNERNKRIRATYGAIYLSTEIQDLQIEQTIKLLNHTNPFNGMKYADDPAIFCVELFNEDAILWHGGNWCFQRYPTIRKRISKEFSNWLFEKYGNESAWREAWGNDAIISNVANLDGSIVDNIVGVKRIKGEKLRVENLKAGTVVPWSLPWALDDIMKPDGNLILLKQRLLDAAEFLIGLQNNFNSRFVDAIREAGYEGEIVGSNWQAGSTVGHLLNLYSDYITGIVDRHNYFGGEINAFKKLGSFKDGSMLAGPGIGTLSAGFQQVQDRPFMLSEWIHVQPNEYYVEGPAILGAYGWGLNGWDVSYMFQNRDNGGFSPKLGLQAWDVSNPAIMATFAAISRQVRRMDIKEAAETKLLNVHIPSVNEGKLSFLGETEQSFDVKSFSTNKVPPAALAATRIAIDFTNEYKETQEFDMEPFMDGNSVVSSTKELRWTPAPDSIKKGGYITINSAGTKAFIGFAPGDESIDLGDGYFITPGKGFSVIYLTAKNNNENLKTTDEIIVTAMARVRNTGMKLNEEENELLEAGEAPLIFEPVKAIVSAPFSGKLEVLDHDGLNVNTTRKFRRNFAIDGAADKTPFYLIQK